MGAKQLSQGCCTRVSMHQTVPRGGPSRTAACARVGGLGVGDVEDSSWVLVCGFQAHWAGGADRKWAELLELRAAKSSSGLRVLVGK